MKERVDQLAHAQQLVPLQSVQEVWHRQTARQKASLTC